MRVGLFRIKHRNMMDLCAFRNVCCKCALLVLLVSCQVKGQPNYVIDTLVIVDSPALNEWLKRQDTTLELAQREQKARETIKEYMSLVIRMANMRLESLTDETNTWTVELSIADFAIGLDPLGGTANILTKTVSYQSAINVIKLWLATNQYADKYDYVLLMTGYDLQGSADLPYDIKGVANIGALCNTDGTSVSIVEDRGGLQSGHFVAHEMGHSLGTTHDGESPNEACPDSDRYLMAIKPAAVTSSNLLNPWQFSECSRRTIGNHVTDIMMRNHLSCLTERKAAVQEYEDSKNVLPGQVYDVKAQCQQLYGPQSTVCLGGRFRLSDVCTSMYCLDTRPGAQPFNCLQHMAADGSSCGDGKICQKGQCVESVFAPDTKFSDCYFGDSVVSIDGDSCSEHIAKSPMSCYQPSIRTACCQSCNDAQTQHPACPFGDKLAGCSTSLCGQVGHDGTRFEEVCCKTCGYDDFKDCVDAPLVDGMSCDRRVSLNGVQGCYDTALAYRCCKTCEGLRKNNTGCEYGDKLPDYQCKRLAYDADSCQTSKSNCCQTCRNLSIGGAQALQSSSFVFICISFVVICLVDVFINRMK